MCLILLAYQAHPHYPLVIAANRDEYFNRPTQAAHHWPAPLPILAGKDLSAGGTWMGIAPNGRFAAVTNVREPQRTPPPNPISRGQLVTDFLASSEPTQAFLDTLGQQHEAYSGFNLVCGSVSGSVDELWHGSNRADSATLLSPGIHGVSNASLNTPWPKLQQGKQALAEHLKHTHFQLESLLPLLNHRARAADSDLPNTGVGLDMERLLSSRFIEGQAVGYGTRTSTALRVDNHGHMEWIEWSWNEQGQLASHVTFSQDLQS